jgi:O-antigen ligase
MLTGAANRRANAAYAFTGLVVAAAVAYVGLPEGVVARFRDIGDTSTQQRIEAVWLSFDLMLENPLVGFGYIEPITGLYPHNLLIEAGLALGLVGAAMMAWMQISLLVNAWRHAQHGDWAIPFLAAAMLANAWISGAIWGSALFFMLLWLLRETPVMRQVDERRPAAAKLVRQ